MQVGVLVGFPSPQGNKKMKYNQLYGQHSLTQRVRRVMSSTEITRKHRRKCLMLKYNHLSYQEHPSIFGSNLKAAIILNVSSGNHNSQ